MHGLSPALRVKALLLILAAALAGSGRVSRAEEPAFDPVTGYRIAHYRAAVPESVPGGTRLWIEDLDRLIAERSPVLLDVMPSEGAGLDPATGEWRGLKPRLSLPGATWLPDVGRGTLTPQLEAYFKASLVRLTGGDPARAVVIFCQSDCWMGWNAVKRASGYGYSSLYWYADGTDGWRDFDRELVPATPVPAGPDK